MNLNEARQAIEAYLAAGVAPFMWGAPGIGKSDLGRQIAKDEGVKMIDYRSSLVDPVDLRGLPQINGDTTKWLPPDELPQVERDGPNGYLFLDELNVAPQSVQAAMFGLVLDRKLGEYRLPDGWKIIAAGNRQSDRAAAQRMPTALANRFAHIDVEADTETFTDWAVRNGLSPDVIAFLRFRPALLHNMEGQNVRAFPSPRSWHFVSNVMKTSQNKSVEFLLPLVTGLIGEGPAAEFMAFHRLSKDLPSLDLIMANPNGAKVPTEPSAKYAIATGLATKITNDDEFRACVTYIQRVGAEYEQLMVIDAQKINVGLSHTQTFVEWAQRNKDVLVVA